MADTVIVEYLYPPAMLDGGWDEKSGNKRVIVRLAGVSDGTGETDVVKIDLSDLKTLNGNVPGRTAIEWIDYNVLSMTVVLEWDRAPHAEICRIDGNTTNAIGRLDWERFGGKVDPGGDDRTGDILLTSTNAANGDSYEITLSLRLKD